MWKKQYYLENCIISEIGVKVKLQDPLNHTSKRIFLIPDLSINEDFLDILLKWGCDGSSGQSQKQQYWDSNNLDPDNDFFFYCSTSIAWFR